VVFFWWQGRGYLTIWIWLTTMCVFGIIMAIGKPVIPDRPWYWGLAFIAAAIANWIKGVQVNAKILKKLPSTTLKNRLFFKGGHRFMSMPMQTFSIPLAIIGILIACRAI